MNQNFNYRLKNVFSKASIEIFSIDNKRYKNLSTLLKTGYFVFKLKLNKRNFLFKKNLFSIRINFNLFNFDKIEKRITEESKSA